MAPINTCEPCCNPLPFAHDELSFRTSVLLILCQLLNSSTVMLCDDEGVPVIVRTLYGASGAPIVDSITAYYVDGSPYVGEIDALVACVGAGV